MEAIPFGTGFAHHTPGVLVKMSDVRLLMLRVPEFCSQLHTREWHEKPPAEAGGLRVVYLPGCHAMWV
jgi:hypothetical protein